MFTKIYVLLILQVGFALSDVLTLNPVCGQCLCSGTNIADSPDGNKVGTFAPTACYKFTGKKEEKGGSSWFSIDFNGNPNNWAAGDSLTVGNDDSCSGSRDADIAPLAWSCVCVIRIDDLDARNTSSMGGRIESVLTKGECRFLTGQTNENDGYNWFQILKNGYAMWAVGEYLELGCHSQCEADKCSQLHLVHRGAWGADPPIVTSTITQPVSQVFIHNTHGDGCTTNSECKELVKAMQSHHINNGWADIAYSFLIGGDGHVYQGRGWNYRAKRVEGFNDDAHEIAFIGNYKTELPSQKMLDAAKALMGCAVQKGYMSADYSLAGHRDISCVENPGDALYSEIQTWNNYLKTPLNKPDCW